MGGTKEIFYNGWARIDRYHTAQANGILFMQGSDSIHAGELWKTDSTETGTVIIKDINPYGTSGAFDPINVNGTIYFTATDYYHGDELWKTDGTEAGTVMVKDIIIGQQSGIDPSYREHIALNNILIFVARDDNHGVELWKSDGTEEGTVLLKDINSGSGSYPRDFIKVNETIFFTAEDHGHPNGRRLWKTDGTTEGTMLVKDTNLGFDMYPQALTNVNGTLFFWAHNPECSSGPCLHKTDGSANGTVKVHDVTLGYTYYAKPVAVGNALFFTSEYSSKGKELWKSDGTEQGTFVVKDIAVTDPTYNPSHEDSNPQDLISVNGKLFFTADDYYHGRELWTSDGTEFGTNMVIDISPELISNSNQGRGTDFEDFVTMHGKLYFIANEWLGEAEDFLWTSDGTENGTEPVIEFGYGGHGDLVVVENNIFYEEGNALWKYTEGAAENNPPNEPAYPNPAQGTGETSVSVNLQFTGGDPDQGDTVTYDVYLSTNDNTPDNLVCNDISATQCDVPFSLAYDTNYYWQVVAIDNHGASTTGPVWQFTTESAPLNNNTPDLPSNPLPAQDEINVTVASTTDLEFTGGDPDQGDTVTYAVYLSANDNTPDNLVCNDISATQCDVPFTLAYDTNYYWQVIATDNHGASTTGPVWHFSTESAHSQVWTLNILRSGSGTVISNPAGLSCGANCSHSFDDGTSVTLTATPSSGWRFSGWSAPCSGTGACTLDMTSHYDVNATFVKIPQSQSVFPWNMFLPAIIQGHR